MWRSSVLNKQRKDRFPARKRSKDGGRGVAARSLPCCAGSNQYGSLLGCLEEAGGTGKAESEAGRPDSGVCRAVFLPGCMTPCFSWLAATSLVPTPFLILSGFLHRTSLCLIPLFVDTSVHRVDAFEGLFPVQTYRDFQ